MNLGDEYLRNFDCCKNAFKTFANPEGGVQGVRTP